MTDIVTHRESVPVQIGAVTLYCESFRAAGSAVIYEQPSVSGKTVVTNRYKRSSELTFRGRVYGTAADTIAVFDARTGSSSPLSLTYRELSFTGCTLRSYSAEDSGGDFTEITATLVTNDSFTLAEGGTI